MSICRKKSKRTRSKSMSEEWQDSSIMNSLTKLFQKFDNVIQSFELTSSVTRQTRAFFFSKNRTSFFFKQKQTQSLFSLYRFFDFASQRSEIKSGTIARAETFRQKKKPNQNHLIYDQRSRKKDFRKKNLRQQTKIKQSLNRSAHRKWT